MLTVKRTFTGALAQTDKVAVDVTEHEVKVTVNGKTVTLTHDDMYRLGRFMVYTSIPSDYAKEKGKEDVVMLNPPKTPILEEGAVEKALRKKKSPNTFVKTVVPSIVPIMEPKKVSHNEILLNLLEDTEKLPVLTDDDTVIEI